MKFWAAINENIINTDPDHYITKLVNVGEATYYIKYYRSLTTKYTDLKTCNATLKGNFSNSMRAKFEKTANEDPDSKLGTYLMINPELKSPDFTQKFEFQRVKVTRYRTGSHNLRIEKDRRFPNSRREDRVCKCNMDVQTIHHVIIDCPLVQDSRRKYDIHNIQDGIMNDDFLLEMECALDVKS